MGRVASTIDALGYATIYGYDALGRQVSVTDPLTNTVTTAYDAEGHIVSQRGATYPVDYSYDEFGDKVSMTTYRNINAIGDVTRWLRDEATGLVTNKVYADGKGPRYDYTPDGKLATRTWARGIVTTYSYDANGALTNTVYSDDTPTISLFYDAMGRQTEAYDAAGVTTFLYDSVGTLTNETVIGVAGTNTIERFWDEYGRAAGYALNGTRQTTIGYDPEAARIESMLANGSDTPFTWSYLPGTDLKSSLAYPNGLTSSRQYDEKGQLLQVCNATPTNIISQYDYTYDAAGRRVARDHSGSAFDHADHIDYCYNTRSELTNALASVDYGYRYSYHYDDIGNRIWSLENTNFVEYAANNLNQYTKISNSQALTFNSQFDPDGNQTLIITETGTWTVNYNGENRPVYWSQGTNLISMTYDRLGRRVVKNDERFAFNDYMSIMKMDCFVPNCFIWDPTEPLASRPLIFINETSAEFYIHDGNKNVSEIVAPDGNITEHYEYAPFGSIYLLQGDPAVANAYCFSSEYFDEDTATVYYNYRHYVPRCGKWVSMDPLGEDSGAGVYLFLGNSPVAGVDVLGECPFDSAVENFINGSLGVDFSFPLLGPYGIPVPIIPGAPRAQINVFVSGEKRYCCDKGTKGAYYHGMIGVEAYLVWGYGAPRPIKGNQRNKPDTERPGQKLKDHQDHPKDSGYRSRDFHADGNLSALEACHVKGLNWSGWTGAIFLRGSVGIGWVGIQGNVQMNLSADMDINSLFSASWGVAHGVSGATIEFGGGGGANWTYR